MKASEITVIPVRMEIGRNTDVKNAVRPYKTAVATINAVDIWYAYGLMFPDPDFGITEEVIVER
jgi:hypothetical protein